MFKYGFFSIGIVVCLFNGRAANAQTDKALVADVLDKFKNALKTQNFESAIRYIDSTTLTYYDSLASDVQEADSLKVEALPLFRRLVVLSFRHRDTSATIRNFSGKKLLTFAMANDMVSDGNIIGDSIHTIKVNGIVATAMTTFLEEGDSLQLHLVKANSSWKINLVAEIDDAARMVSKLQQDIGLSETAFIMDLLENMTGRVPTATIWRKPD